MKIEMANLKLGTTRVPKNALLYEETQPGDVFSFRSQTDEPNVFLRISGDAYVNLVTGKYHSGSYSARVVLYPDATLVGGSRTVRTRKGLESYEAELESQEDKLASGGETASEA